VRDVPKLVRLYRAAVSRLAKRVEPPRAWETLREYYRRTEHVLPSRAPEALRRFLHLYELFLYSSNSVSEEADRVARDVK